MNNLSISKLEKIFSELLFGDKQLSEYYSFIFTKEFILNLSSTYGSRWNYHPDQMTKYKDVEELISLYPPNKQYLEIFDDLLRHIKDNHVDLYNDILYSIITDYSVNIHKYNKEKIDISENSDMSCEIYDAILQDHENFPLVDSIAIDLLNIDKIKDVFFPNKITLNIKPDSEYIFNIRDYNNEIDKNYNTNIDINYDGTNFAHKIEVPCEYIYTHRELITIYNELHFNHKHINSILLFVIKYIIGIEILSDIVSDDNYDFIDSINIIDILQKIKRKRVCVLIIIDKVNEILEAFEPKLNMSLKWIEDIKEININSKCIKSMINIIMNNYKNPERLINEINDI